MQSRQGRAERKNSRAQSVQLSTSEDRLFRRYVKVSRTVRSGFEELCRQRSTSGAERPHYQGPSPDRISPSTSRHDPLALELEGRRSKCSSPATGLKRRWPDSSARPGRPAGPERGDVGENRLPRVGGQTGTAAAGGGRRDRRRSRGGARTGGGWAASPSASGRRRTAWGSITAPTIRRGPAQRGESRTSMRASNDAFAAGSATAGPRGQPAGLVTRRCRHDRRAPAGMRGQYPCRPPAAGAAAARLHPAQGSESRFTVAAAAPPVVGSESRS